MRDVAINLRALSKERDLIDQAARLVGKTRSDFMLEAAYSKAQAVLLEQVFFSIDEETFGKFMTLLDAPPSDQTGLLRLMEVKPPWQSNTP